MIFSDYHKLQTRSEKLAFLKSVFEGNTEIPKEFIHGEMSIENDPYVLATLISCYGRICCREDALNLIPFLSHMDQRVRANCVDVIRFLDNPLTYEHASRLVTDENPRVRANACRMFTAEKKDENITILQKMVLSKDPSQVRSAVFVLHFIRDEQAESLLSEALRFLNS